MPIRQPSLAVPFRQIRVAGPDGMPIDYAPFDSAIRLFEEAEREKQEHRKWRNRAMIAAGACAIATLYWFVGAGVIR